MYLSPPQHRAGAVKQLFHAIFCQPGEELWEFSIEIILPVDRMMRPARSNHKVLLNISAVVRGRWAGRCALLYDEHQHRTEKRKLRLTLFAPEKDKLFSMPQF